MISRLDQDMYWHIPRSGSVLRMDKERKRFVLIKGDIKAPEMRSLSVMLSRCGYDLITRDTEVGEEYFTA